MKLVFEKVPKEEYLYHKFVRYKCVQLNIMVEFPVETEKNPERLKHILKHEAIKYIDIEVNNENKSK